MFISFLGIPYFFMMAQRMFIESNAFSSPQIECTFHSISFVVLFQNVPNDKDLFDSPSPSPEPCLLFSKGVVNSGLYSVNQYSAEDFAIYW